MMRSIKYILFFIFCTCINIYAQTPYDSFSPATSRPILDVVQKMDANKDSLQQTQMDTTLATKNDVSKWLSPDPLSDKYPEISPYAYCGWNPVKYIDPDGRDIYRYDKETGDIKLYKKTDDNFDQFGKFKYNRRTNEYELRTKKDGTIRTYTDHKGNNDKIAKGILKDGLNIKNRGAFFSFSKNENLTEENIFQFALILDQITGVEISGFISTDFGNKRAFIEPYKHNTRKRSNNHIREYSPNTYLHFHTHGHALHYQATHPSEKYDIPFKEKINRLCPTIQLIILHNYGAPTKY